MYHFFHIFLTILGLRFPTKINTESFYKNKNEQLNSLDVTTLGEIDPDKSVVDNELAALIDFNCIRIPKFTDCMTNYRQILFWFYSTFIFFLLLVEPIFLIYQSVTKKDLSHISNISFILIPPLQHIIAIKYFRSQSFDKIYYEVSKLKDTHHCIKDDRILSLAIIIPSTLSIIVSIIGLFIDIGTEENLYLTFAKHCDLTSQVFLFIFELIYWFYSRNIIFLVVLVFFFVFIKHINDMRSLIYTATHNNIWVDDPTIVSEFIHVIIKLRYELNNSISKLSYVYVFTTILGAIAVGNVIDHLKADPLTIVSSIIFVLFQLVFLFIIYLISVQQDGLGGIIRHPVFSAKYIYRKYKPLDFSLNFSPISIIPFLARGSVNAELNDFSATSIGRLLKNFRDKSIKSNSPPYHINITETGNVIPLGNIHDIQKETPRNSLHNRDDIVNENSGITEVIVKKPRKKKHHHEKIEEDFFTPQSTPDPIIKEEPLSPALKDIVKRINQSSNFNGSSIDYIILHLLIADNWTNNFELIGIQFNGTDAIKKAIGITSVIMLASGLISKFVIIT